MLHKLYYISQGNTSAEHLKNIDLALKGGIKIIQLRLKNISFEEYLSIAEFVFKQCIIHHAIFIVNDNVEIAKRVNAHGVHLGLNDESVKEARKQLGNKLIGGTANTKDDVLKRLAEGVDYIGLGPFRFTTTKEKLSPVLGTEGIKEIITATKPNIPVYAIGGIEENDIDSLMQTGIHGIAVSGLITHHPNKKEFIDKFNSSYTYVENC